MRLHVLNGSYSYGENRWGTGFGLLGMNFSMTYWRDLHFVLYSRFKEYFVSDDVDIDACIFFGPPTWRRKLECAAVPSCRSGKLTIYVEEATDADHAAYKICPNVWSIPCDRRMLRVTGGLPGRLVKNGRLESCRSVEIPWVTHIRELSPQEHKWERKTKRVFCSPQK